MNNDLIRARERVRALGRAQNRLHVLCTSCTLLVDRVAELVERVRREGKDVARLEGSSLQALFHAVLGDKVETLAEERRELLSAQMKLDAARAELAVAETERVAVLERIKSLEGAPAELAGALEEAEKIARAEDGPLANELRALSAQSATAKERHQQLLEALEAAGRASRALAEVDRSLSSARGWGTFDMLGGGFIATSMKHARLSDSRAHIARAHGALSALERELADVRAVGSIEKLEVPITGGLTFADYMFDGLIIDWMVQTRIREGLDRAQSVRRRVSTVEAELHRESSRTAQLLAELDARRGTALGDSPH